MYFTLFFSLFLSLCCFPFLCTQEDATSHLSIAAEDGNLGMVKDYLAKGANAEEIKVCSVRVHFVANT
jgi:hypothetical protein